MAGTPDLGTGVVLTFAGITVNLTNIGMSGISREAIDTTHLGSSGAKSYLPSDLYEPGSLECEFQVDTTGPVTTQQIATFMGTSVEAWTIQSGGSLGKWTGNGFIVDFSQDWPTEELMTGSFTLKCTGAITTADTA